MRMLTRWRSAKTAGRCRRCPPAQRSSEDYWAPAFELILEEARRSIDRQSDRVQHVRERAVGLVGFGSIVAAALGLDTGSKLGVAGYLALGAFVVVAAVGLFVLFPRRFEFELSARRMDAWFDDPHNSGVHHMLHSAAVLHDEHHERNHLKLARLQGAIALGVAALSVETIALIVRLVLR